MVGCSGRADDDGADEVDSGFVDLDVDGIGEVCLQDFPFFHDGAVDGSTGVIETFPILD